MHEDWWDIIETDNYEQLYDSAAKYENSFLLTENSLLFEDEWERQVIRQRGQRVCYLYSVPITGQDYPSCLGKTDYNCDECSFVIEDQEGRCRLQQSRWLRNLVWNTIAPWVKVEKAKDFLREAIEHELRLHGRALHYTIIARIVVERYPDMNATESSVYQTLWSHPDVFQRVAPGVYRVDAGRLPSQRSGK